MIGNLFCCCLLLMCVVRVPFQKDIVVCVPFPRITGYRAVTFYLSFDYNYMPQCDGCVVCYTVSWTWFVTRRCNLGTERYKQWGQSRLHAVGSRAVERESPMKDNNFTHQRGISVAVPGRHEWIFLWVSGCLFFLFFILFGVVCVCACGV